MTLFIVPVALTHRLGRRLAFGIAGGGVMLRGSDQVLRYSIDKATVELLYLPVPAAQTFHVKSFIDTVVYRLGDGLGGVTVLIFAARPALDDAADGVGVPAAARRLDGGRLGRRGGSTSRTSARASTSTGSTPSGRARPCSTGGDRDPREPAAHRRPGRSSTRSSLFGARIATRCTRRCAGC